MVAETLATAIKYSSLTIKLLVLAQASLIMHLDTNTELVTSLSRHLLLQLEFRLPRNKCLPNKQCHNRCSHNRLSLAATRLMDLLVAVQFLLQQSLLLHSERASRAETLAVRSNSK